MICHFLSDISNLRVHSQFTNLAFLASLLSITLNIAPEIYKAWSYCAVEPDRVKQGTSTLRLLTSTAGILLWLTIGLMRRGPLLRYNEVQLGTGFGISGTKDVDADPEGPNVIDWKGCPLLKLVILSQVSQMEIRAE